jgi:hypothetical protein
LVSELFLPFGEIGEKAQPFLYWEPENIRIKKNKKP